MAKLTKRTTEQLRSYLSSLSADELVEVLLSHAARDNDLRDRLLIESAKRGGADVDLKSFQRSINAAGLFTWEVDGHWDVFVDAVSHYADVLGPEGVAHFRQLAVERWSHVLPAGPGDRDTERWAASYRITRVMERLAELTGDVDELVAVKSHDLSMPYDWLEVAEVYAGADRHEEALDWAERGVAAFPDQPDPRLDEFLCEAYHRAGRHTEAVELAWQRFQARPELTTYQRLADHATKAGAWSEWRPGAVAVLRGRIHAGGPSAAQCQPSRRPVFEPVGATHLVEVLLWEGYDEAGWQEAVEAGVPHRIWMRLANIRQDEHPNDAIPIFQGEVEQLISTKNNRGYADAVAMMDHVRNLLGSYR